VFLVILPNSFPSNKCVTRGVDGPCKVTSNLWDFVIPKYDIACTIEVIVRDVDKYDLKVLSLPVDIL